MAFSTRTFGFGGVTPAVKRLMIANVAVFAVSLFAGAFVIDWFAFQPTRIFVRPWGAVTYMFVHGDLMHLAVNMLILFFFGPPLEGRWGEREFLKFYFICGLGGVALSFVFLPNAVIGASAAVYGVMLAFAMNWPRAPIYIWGIFPVEARYLVGFMFVLSLLSAVQGTGGGIAHFAHLGGLVVGFIYLKADWRSKQILGRKKKSGSPSRRLAIVPREPGSREESVASSDRPSRDEAALYDQVDAVLDKISAKGMASLTADELKLLDEVSKRHRSN